MRLQTVSRRFAAKLTAPKLATCGLAALVALSAGCNSASSVEITPNAPGSIGQNPETGRFFIVDESKAGLATQVRIVRVAWGRLVDVYGRDHENKRFLMNEDFVISPSLSTNESYSLETNPVTASETLTIEVQVADAFGLIDAGVDAYHALLLQSEQNLEPLFDNGLNGSGFFSMLPRNATAVLQFDDLISEATLDNTTVRTVVGTPSVLPYEARLMIDKNHGDLSEHDGVSGLEFYTSRVLVDMTVSELESFQAVPPLPVNTLGLPPSVNSNLSNAQIRIPTKKIPDQGQDRILENPSGHGLTTTNNGSVDYSSPFLPVARAFRSGGQTEVTSDPYNGFLRDFLPPRVVGVQNGAIVKGPGGTSIELTDLGNLEFVVRQYNFQSSFCSQEPALGDIISQPGVFAEVINPLPAPGQGDEVRDIHVRLISFPSDWVNGAATWVNVGEGPAQFLSPYIHAEDQGRAACFLTITPQANDVNSPTTNIESTATVRVRFNEPMDPDRVNAFDAVTLTRVPNPQQTYDYVVGELAHSIDLHEYHFLQSLPLDHDLGENESYYLNLVAGHPDPDIIRGPVDLAGNELFETFPQVELILKDTTLASDNGGRVSFFTTADEEYPIGNSTTKTLPEWAGQHLFDLQRGVIRPRPVVHFQGVVDRTNNPFVAAMAGTLVGQTAPLSNFGSKTQLVWRYLDMGLDLYKQVPPLQDMVYEIQPTTFNIDVEGLSWAPFGGEVVPDSFTLFEMRLNHSKFFPDESGATSSGLVDIYDNNFLNAIEDPQYVVHPRFEGYNVNPGDIYVANGDLKLIPFPMNFQVSPDDYRYYTWRDTGKRTRGGPDVSGVPPEYYYSITGDARPCQPNLVAMGDCSQGGCWLNPLYTAGEVQTVGLPLLMEFRCWQDDGAVGINRFDTSTAPSSVAGPFWRAHSTGGIPQTGPPIYIEPDLETRANGGYDPNSIPVPGAKTPGNDSEVYLGAADFVVRVSRSHSIWFSAVDPNNPDPSDNFTAPNYNPPVAVPNALDQPIGTSVKFAFRGATSVTPTLEAIPDGWETDANQDDLSQLAAANDVLWRANDLDLYGDHYEETTGGCFDLSFNHIRGPELNMGIGTTAYDWLDEAHMINGSQYYQVRITWKSNPITGLSPELTSFAMTWSQ